MDGVGAAILIFGMCLLIAGLTSLILLLFTWQFVKKLNERLDEMLPPKKDKE